MTTRKPDQRIERARGMTYSHETFSVYEYDTYDRNSVLAGQQRRRRIGGGFITIADALKQFPNAVPSGCGYTEPVLSHLPDPEGSDPFGDNEDAAKDY